MDVYPRDPFSFILIRPTFNLFFYPWLPSSNFKRCSLYHFSSSTRRRANPKEQSEDSTGAAAGGHVSFCTAVRFLLLHFSGRSDYVLQLAETPSGNRFSSPISYGVFCNLISLSVSSFFAPQVAAQSRNRRQVWRRRKLTKEDDMMRVKLGRVPFLEEQVRKIRENGKMLSFDIEWLMKNEDNKYEFVNEVAAEATEYIERNRDEYGGNKKAILHVLSNRMNDAGFYRPEAYEVSDPFRPGPDYLKEEFT
ncbi:unnamed protein product [Linum tenue]|uniref:Protein PLASTID TRANSCRIPTIONALLY ACTIVE 7 n=1 Tax=Linum tenue TaxID=586396 RepID=A0AAV0R746_9ROSI|nr:unnamed protein product [Linum tenue]